MQHNKQKIINIQKRIIDLSWSDQCSQCPRHSKGKHKFPGEFFFAVNGIELHKHHDIAQMQRQIPTNRKRAAGDPKHNPEDTAQRQNPGQQPQYLSPAAAILLFEKTDGNKAT